MISAKSESGRIYETSSIVRVSHKELFEQISWKFYKTWNCAQAHFQKQNLQISKTQSLDIKKFMVL